MTVRNKATLVALLGAVLAFSILQSVIVPALPIIQHQLRVSVSTVSWVLSAFLLSSSVSAIIVGRLGDMFGRKRLMLVSLAATVIGSVLAACSGTIGLLIAARAVQGIGSATFPLAYGIVRESFSTSRVPVAIGTISATFGAGFAIGLVVPGPLIDAFGWPAIFWLSAAFGVIAALLVAISVRLAAAARTDARIDGAGAAVLAVALSAGLLAINESRSWPPALTIGLGIAAVSLLLGFVVFELRLAEPLVQPRLFGNRVVASADIVALLAGFGLYGAFSLVPQLVLTSPAAGYGFGASSIGAGLFLLPMAITMSAAGPIAGRLGRRVGFERTLVAACVLAAVGYVTLAVGIRSAGTIVVGTGILGVGVGFTFASVVNIVVGAVAPSDTGQASAVNTVVRTIGGAIGADVAATLLTAFTAVGSSVPALDGYRTAFLVSAAGLVVAAVTAVTAAGARTRATSATSATSATRPS